MRPCFLFFKSTFKRIQVAKRAWENIQIEVVHSLSFAMRKSNTGTWRIKSNEKSSVTFFFFFLNQVNDRTMREHEPGLRQVRQDD